MTDTVALIPVSRLDRAKERLAGLLSPSQRREISLASLRTVVEASRSAGLEPVLVTAEGGLEDQAGARVLVEPPDAGGLNPALEFALQTVEPHQSAAILHADLPLASGTGLRRVLDAPGDVVLVRSRDGGTNVMLLRRPGTFALGYGRGSFARHVARAHAAGLAISAVVSPDLELDLDTPSDAAALIATDAGRSSPVGRLLISWGLDRHPLTHSGSSPYGDPNVRR